MELYKRLVEQQLTHKGELWVEVKGISMLPTLKNGEKVRIVAKEKYQKGEIVMFCYKDRFLVHRIVKIIKDRCFCKGDNTMSLERISIQDIIGKVEKCQEEGGGDGIF